jgi:uncharacterized protein (DUF1501 family)
MKTPQDSARRHFLRATAGLAAAAGPGLQLLKTPLAAQLAGLAALAASSRSHAADTSGPYKALVCLFMNGGNDSHNWVVPTDATGYAEYAAVRRELAVPANKLQGISTSGQGSGRSFGMPEELAPLRRWYEAGQAALVANVGPLLRPITKAEYLAQQGVPAKLFSHNDQQSTWQSLSPEGARSGWGGRLGDVLMSANAQPVFTAVSATGNAVFLAGSRVTQYQVSADGPVAVNGLTNPLFGATAAPAALRRSLADGGAGAALQAEVVRVMQRSINASAVLQTALPGVSVPPIPATPIPAGAHAASTLDKDSLARQLRMVAAMIGAGPTLGMRRQVFMVSMGGFDTHANQVRDQPALMSRVALSVDYFLQALATMGLLDNVVLFSASDFGRTLVSNGAGSDHGWGSHHFVAGGTVRGGAMYGSFPVTALGTSNDVGSGRLLPGTSVTEYAATLGAWMGLSSSELTTVLPNLGSFAPGGLGFV